MDLTWLEHHTLPCPIKSIFGIDCPGCGFQRSALLLLRGDLIHSFLMFPALIPFLLTIVFMIFHLKYKPKYGMKVLMSLYAVTVSAILINFVVKQFLHYHA